MTSFYRSYTFIPSLASEQIHGLGWQIHPYPGAHLVFRDRELDHDYQQPRTALIGVDSRQMNVLRDSRPHASIGENQMIVSEKKASYGNRSRALLT